MSLGDGEGNYAWHRPNRTQPTLRFLSTLERRPAVPTKEVEAIIAAAGYPLFTPWLAFHERYAGYVEQFYNDWFIWGLAHRESYWWGPNAVACERDGASCSIWCAEGHPTYSYELDQDGRFGAHGQHRSFDLYVERVAAVRELVPRESARELQRDELHGEVFLNFFRERIQPFLVAELSDQFCRFYLSDTHFVLEDAENGKFRRAWERRRS